MTNKYFIQKPGEKGIDLFNMFRTVAILGVGPIGSIPISANIGDIYVSDDTFEVSTWNGTSYDSRLIINREVVYDQLTYTCYIYDNGLTIYYDYKGVVVKEVLGINDIPERKDVFSENWKDQQGLDVFLPENTYFKNREVEISFFIEAKSIQDYKSNINTFINFISADQEVLYFDQYRKSGFIGYYISHEVSEESFKSNNWSLITIKFGINTLCSGLDLDGVVILDIMENSKYSLLIDKKYTIYFEDGSVFSNIKGNIAVSNLNNKYAIFVKSFIDQLDITRHFSNYVIGVTDGLNNYVVGIQGNVIGI